MLRKLIDIAQPTLSGVDRLFHRGQMPSMVWYSHKVRQRCLVFREEVFSGTELQVCTMEYLVVERPWFVLQLQWLTEASILRAPQKVPGDL